LFTLAETLTLSADVVVRIAQHSFPFVDRNTKQPLKKRTRKSRTNFLGNKNKTKKPNKKSLDFSNLSFFVPNFVVTRLGVEPRTY